MLHLENTLRQVPQQNILAGLLLLLMTTGCQTVKPYQRAYINDREMQLGRHSSEKSEVNAMTYREGASGGGTGKASGGCGCN